MAPQETMDVGTPNRIAERSQVHFSKKNPNRGLQLGHLVVQNNKNTINFKYFF
jgi:hypothetical protein